MTAPDTPSREEVLFALMDAHRNFMATGAHRPSDERWDDMTDAVIELYRHARLAAKPAGDGVREAVVEITNFEGECRKVLEAIEKHPAADDMGRTSQALNRQHYEGKIQGLRYCLHALSPKAKP